MDVPAAARPRFDALVNRPLERTRAELKRFQAFAAALRDEPPSEEALRVVDRVEALIGRVERSTSPLYTRLIHATGRFISEEPVEDWALAGGVLDAVAYTTRHFDLMLGDAP